MPRHRADSKRETKERDHWKRLQDVCLIMLLDVEDDVKELEILALLLIVRRERMRLRDRDTPAILQG
jgi:hypothetical protein